MGTDPAATLVYAVLGVLLAIAAIALAFALPWLVRRFRERRHARISNARRAAHTGIDLFSAPSDTKKDAHRAKRRGASAKRNHKIDLFGTPPQ